MSQYYTIFDVAESLKCSDDQVRKLIAVGELATISLAMPGSKRQCIRISQQLLDAFIESRTCATSPPLGAARTAAAGLPPVNKWV